MDNKVGTSRFCSGTRQALLRESCRKMSCASSTTTGSIHHKEKKKESVPFFSTDRLVETQCTKSNLGKTQMKNPHTLKSGRNKTR